MKINPNFSRLPNNYLFAEIDRRVSAYRAAHPGADIIKLGIGDVTLPLAPAVVRAGEQAVADLGRAETFRGYGPYRGYLFLTEAIVRYYATHGVNLDEREVFVTEGAKSDIAHILDLFAPDVTVLVPDPVYPVYADTNLLAGHTVRYVDATRENDFLPRPPADKDIDLIYLCSPNNPTGAVFDRERLRAWVDYARSIGAVILYDAAYEFFVQGDLPHSIYEIEGANECAVEFCSLSKTAGFTGVRCGYTIVPRGLGELNALWLRRQATASNGVSYVVQRMAEAVFTPEGQAQCRAAVDVYRRNAACISDTLTDMGVYHTGGVHSPYVWMRCDGDSWAFFDRILASAQVVGTPGAGFGKNGEGYFRLTAFNDYEHTAEAMRRLRAVY